jgi:hypothetical protein
MESIAPDTLQMQDELDEEWVRLWKVISSL